MPSYLSMSSQEIQQEIKLLEQAYASFSALKLNLNMTRGKPCDEQLALSNGLLTVLDDQDYLAADGTDCRNYGGVDGLPEARALFAELLGTRAEQVMVQGNSSLNFMYDTLVKALLFGVPGSESPWAKQEPIKFICPVPGYDRHFFVTQSFGIEMIPVPMTPTGPDMDLLERLVAEDASIKGMWSIPVYSNPDGITYSEETCHRLATMQTAAPDFRIFWDNAYVVHHFYDDRQESVPDMIDLCEQAGHPDRVLEFASTSKITFAGAGLACIAAGKNNIDWLRKLTGIQTIGPDKVNQLRHVRFLKNKEGVREIMIRHADILRPKFDLVLDTLARELGSAGVFHWQKPKGGYFISVFVAEGTAAEVVRLAAGCGVALTPAGNPYPYGKDPAGSNIRLSPSFPPVEELKQAIDIFCVCARLAALRKLANQA